MEKKMKNVPENESVHWMLTSTMKFHLASEGL